MIFNFVVRHLHFLARVPLAPQFFDAALLTWTALFHRQRLVAMDDFEQGLSNLEIDRCVHRFGGTGFVRDGREFAHLHGNGLLDIELTRELANQIVQQKRATPHHVLGRSRWVSVWLISIADVPNAIELVELGLKSIEQKSRALPPSFCEVCEVK